MVVLNIGEPKAQDWPVNAAAQANEFGLQSWRTFLLISTQYQIDAMNGERGIYSYFCGGFKVSYIKCSKPLLCAALSYKTAVCVV
jgi:hypothetical protein